MKRKEIVLEGAQYFLEAETAVDEALAKLMHCGYKLSVLRKEAGLSKTFGQDAMTSLVRTITCVGNGMENMVAMHSQLSQVKDDMGCRTVAVGDEANKPEKGTGSGAGISNLTVVGRDEAA